jgi:hypothetical protein
MRRVILSSVACPAVPYFFLRHDFRGGGGLFNIKCVFWFPLQILNILYSNKNSASHHKRKHVCLHVRYRLFGHVVMKLKFSRQFSKKTQISNFMKIFPVMVKLFHADRQTDRQAWRSWQSLFVIFVLFCSCSGGDIGIADIMSCKVYIARYRSKYKYMG